MIGTGIYIDDINAQFIEKLKSEVVVIALILLVVIFMGGLLVRSLKKPLRA
ncbi:hypothetical protein [Thiomicrorhabdus aquaedulcis]|uniref:hypothetical protein n=1 Tax=Thiomicrorhabdus aquaedulcis TaxID=2211106 RepID=UPI003B836F07